jgi:SAM-dependent methyltransferase
MSQTPSTEEILRRMSVHVSQHSAGSQSPSAAQAGSANDQTSHAPASPEGGASSGFRLESLDFSLLRCEIETALEGTRQVAQINPRNPGLHNDAIQFMKKVMRRSLAWYTRPLHYFQGGVVRALEHIVVLLQGHEDSLQTVSREVAELAGVIEQRSQESSKRRAAFASDITALNDKAVVLDRTASAQVKKTLALEEKAAALLENTSRLRVIASALEETASQLDSRISALVQRLSQANAELEGKLSQTHSEFNARLTGTGLAQDEKLSQALVPYSQRIASLTDGIHALRSEFGRISNELRVVKTQGRGRDRDLRRFFHDLQTGAIAPSKQTELAPIPAMFPSRITSNSKFDYFLFEELYRGDEALITTRQKEYLELFRGRDDVLDVGCGRGEFLELLRDSGVSAKGVESGTDQYLLCREKGLDVVEQDLFEYLESLPDESLGGLFSAQVIEHLAASDQLHFVSLAYRKTRPGSPVVFETINPQCVFAMTRNFFLDPTHVRPVHPETLKFAMESVEFRNVGLRFSSPMSERRIPPLKLNGDTPELEDFNRAIAELNELIYGYMDYAAVGWR